jgi:hypothetical protein
MRQQLAPSCLSVVALAALSALAAWTTLASPARAIDIDFIFGPQSESPSFDPNGTQMMTLFAFAEDFYEDVFEDSNWSVQLAVSYSTFTDTTLGLYTPILNTIQMDADTNWFIDPTPSDNSEFLMSQTLWRDLAFSQQSDWFNFQSASAVPATFEVGFGGNAFAGTAAAGAVDMLSVVLHEVGHALGLGTFETPFEAALDRDYDFDPDWVFDIPLAAEQANLDNDDGLNFGHLEATPAMMSPSVNTSQRKLPSHTDLFSMAGSLGLNDLDVPRREFYGNSNWQNDGNWSGETEPGALDEVFVRDAQGSGTTLTARLTANGVAGALHVSEGANVDTDSFKLDVTGDVDISDVDSDLFIDAGGELEARDVAILNSAEIEMSGGTLDVRQLTIGEGTQLELRSANAAATVDVSSLLVNDGQIIARDGATLTFISSAANPWDLDGTTGAGIVNALAGNLNFASGGVTDPHGGRMRIGGSNAVTIAEDWSLGSTGRIEFASSGALRGGEVDLRGELAVQSGTADVDSQLTMDDSGVIDVAGGAQLRQNGPLLHRGHIEIDAGGAMHTNGDVLVTTGATSRLDGELHYRGQTSINAGNLAGGGAIVIHDTTLAGRSARININTLAIEDRGEGLFQGATVTANTLNVQGDLALEQDAAVQVLDDTVVAGQGTLQIDQSVLTTKGLVLQDSGALTLRSGNLNVVDFERQTGSTFNHQGGTLTFAGGSGSYNSSVNLGTPDNPTVRIEKGADVAVTYGWRIGLDEGTQGHTTVTGTRGTARSTLRGTGGGAGADVIVGGAGLGVMRVEAGALVDLRDDLVVGESSTGSGELYVTGMKEGYRSTLDVTGGGTASIIDIAKSGTGLVQVTRGGLLQTSSDIFVARGVGSDGNVTVGGFNGSQPAELIAADDIFLGGTATSSGGRALLTIADGGRVEGDRMVVWEGSRVDLDGGELKLNTLDVDTHGGLVNLNGGVYDVDHVLGTVDMNEMVIRPGSSPGIMTVEGDLLTTNSLFEIELGGLLPGSQYDRIEVTGVASLDGALDVRWYDLGEGLFTPAAGDSFEILSAAKVLGGFDRLTVASLPEGLGWDLDYSPTAVTLSIFSTLEGDLNGDLIVDGQDLADWESQFGTVGDSSYALGDGDGDGDADGQDLLNWQREFGTDLTGRRASVAATVASVPEPATWLLAIGLAGLVAGRRSLL